MAFVLALTFALACLAVHLASAVLAARHMGQSVSGTVVPATDRIALLRPVCGIDTFDAETLGSSFRQDWPDYEIVFCAPSDTDAAVPLVRSLMAAHPGVRARLLTGQERRSGNPKLDNIWKGWDVIDAPWVCMADSNLLLPPDYLRTLAATWRPDSGLVSSPAWGDRPRGLAARLECAFLNGNQARFQLASASLDAGFAQGKTLFWNRAFLNDAGGLAPLGRWLAEDVASTRLVRARGRKVHLPPRPYAQPIGPRSFAQVWGRQLRWSVVRRDGFPGLFVTEVLNGPVLPVLGLALVGAWGWLIAFLAVWYAAEWMLNRVAGWPASAADVAAMPLRDLLIPAIWALTFLQKGISWRGNDMTAPARRDGA